MPDTFSSESPRHSATRTRALSILAVLALIAAAFLARDVLIPIAIAVVFAVLLRPVVRWLEGLRLPTALGATIVTLALIALVAAAVALVAGPAERWAKSLPQRITDAQHKLERFRQPLQKLSDTANQIQRLGEIPLAQSAPATSASQPDTTSAPASAPAPAPSSASPNTTLIAHIFGATASAVGQVVTVVLLLALLLAAGDMFQRKLLATLSTPDSRRSATAIVKDAQTAIRRYVLVTLMINVGQGLLVALMLWLIKFPSPLLWGLATVVLEFVPYLGAVVMVALLALVGIATSDSLGHAAIAPLGYLVITTLQNNLVSPIAYGKRLELNPTAVLVSVMAIYLLWGVAGAFLAVPLTAILKAAADHLAPKSPALHATAQFLGD